MMEKVILDTDIGSDIDDAVCLPYLLAEKECDLLGIITVHGDTKVRAKLASVLVKASGKDIPIFCGLEKPLLGPNPPKTINQEPGLAGLDYDEEFKGLEWIEFVKNTIYENPGEINLLAIGPLTNVAVLFTLYPETAKMLKRLVIMGGRFFDGLSERYHAEYNIRCDYAAADIVYKSEAPIIESLGLDSTLNVTMNRQTVKETFSKYDLLKPVLQFSAPWFDETRLDEMIFHDPLTAVYMFHPDVVEMYQGNVKIEVQSDIRPGRTLFKESENGRHFVSREVSADKFFKYYFDVFKETGAN